MGTPGLLNGSNDYLALSGLYAALGQPQNRSQELFVRVLEAGHVTDDRLLPVLGNFVRQNQQDFESVLA